MTFLRKYLEQCDTRYQQPTQPCALQGGSMRSGLYFYSLSRLKVCSLFVAVRAKKKRLRGGVIKPSFLTT